MSLWEYKVITSGKGGFVSPALMEKFLNDLGKDEWEIIAFHTQPENLLAFTGLARRSTQRDWTLADAAAAAAKVEAEKLRQEFEAKFKGARSAGPAAPEEKPESVIAEKAAPEDGFRKPIDTSRDDDPDAQDEEKDEWDKLGQEEELPTFFEAIRPHLRRNQRGAGMSVGTEYLAKKWDLAEDDIKGALLECGFVLPEDEDAKPVYLEYDGDLYWLNINRRGELWLNTKEKPRPVFRAVPAQRVTVEEPAEVAAPAASDQSSAKPVFEPKPRREQQPQQNRRETPEASETAPQPGAPLPEGVALLAKIRPLMRRNRRGPGGSGSFSFLARALKCSEAELSAAFTAMGLLLPASSEEKPSFVELDGDLWWLNQDSRGGVWINGREKKEGETAATAAAPAPNEFAPSAPTPATTPAAPAAQTETLPLAPSVEPHPELPQPLSVSAEPSAASPASAANATDSGNVFAAVRLLLKETKTGAVAGKLERVAEALGRPADDLLAALVGVGLKVPEKAREKPVFVEHQGEIFWLNKNAKDELWVNAKASKFAEKEGDEGAEGGEEKASRRPRSRKKDE